MITGGRFYKKKEFIREKKRNAYVIIADTSLQKYDSSKHGRYEKFSYLGQIYVVKPRITGVTTGFIELGEKRLIAVKKYGWMIPVLPVVLGIMLLCVGILGKSGSLKDIPIVGELIENYTETQEEQEYMTVPGLKEHYRLSVDNREMYLINPKGNTVYFKYILSVEGVKIYETDYVEPDRMVRADLYSQLDAGDYQVDVTIMTIETKTHEACNGATLSTNVTIVKD